MSFSSFRIFLLAISYCSFIFLFSVFSSLLLADDLINAKTAGTAMAMTLIPAIIIFSHIIGFIGRLSVKNKKRSKDSVSSTLLGCNINKKRCKSKQS